MKQWVQKFINQLDYDWGSEKSRTKAAKINEERATILFLLDTYNKHLLDIETHPVRRVREALDGFAKELVNADKPQIDDVLFRFRQYFASYRVAEYSYIRKTFEDFKGIVWNFVEQMSEDIQAEQADDQALHASLQQLREAVETDSIDALRQKSREFITSYVQHNSKREQRRSKRLKGIRKNLDLVKKQLSDADRTSRLDHLTQAYNRLSFDEHAKQQHSLFNVSKSPVTMIIMDIDHFKKINDTYGHDIGDFVLKECVSTLQTAFPKENDFVARIGGEEFAVILPSHAIEHAVKRAEDTMNRIRKEVFVTGENQLRFTVSMGIAQLQEGESIDQWIKRADTALYQSKHSGRNKYTIAPSLSGVDRVA